jgi:DNA-binding NarL/FixJ family response regulator
VTVGGRSTLVGRRDELAVVKRLLTPSRRGNRWLEVAGDPGAGKSHLLAELGVLAGSASWTVLAGRATEPLRPTAYGVLAETLGCAADPDEIGRRLASAGSGGVALVVDDFHWADTGSIELIAELVERPLPVPLLVCVAYRSRQAPPVRPPAGGTRLDLGPLSPAESAQLVGGRELYEASGGFPGYLKVLAGADPVVELAAEIAPLGPDLLVVARAAAVAGDAFDVDLAAAVAQVDPASAAARIEELGRRDLVRPAGGPGRWRWRHPVVRTAVYGLVPPGWCLAAHERAAAVLVRRGAGAADVAPHLARAGRSGDQSAIDLLERAGDEAATTDPTGAACWWDAAVRLLPGTPESGSRRSRLLVRQARALAVTGRFGESRALVHELLEQLPVTAAEQRLAALRLEAMLALALGQPDEAAAALVAGYPATEQLAANPPAAVALPSGLAAGFHADRALVSVHRGRWAEADRAADRAIELAGTAADQPELPPAAVTAHSVRALCATRAGRPEPARRHLHRAATRLDRMPDADLADHLPLAVQVAWAALAQERDETAGRHALRGVEIGRRTGRRHVLPELLSVLAAARLRRGLVPAAAEAVTWLDEASAGRDGLDAMVGALRAAVALDSGDTRSGLRHAERAVAARPAIVPGWDGAAEEAMARALLAHGDPDGCLTVLTGLSGRELNGRRCDLGAEAAVMLGQVDEARRWAGLAEAAATRSGLVGEVAHGLLAAARAALAAGDPTIADQQAAAAGSGFAALGWGRDEQRAGSVRSAAAGGRAGALTRREREIAELVCQGHLNREIAELLYLSPRTVENHVARILDKLGAASRAGVAMRLVSRERLAVSHAS